MSVYINYRYALTGLGEGVNHHFDQILKGVSAIKKIDDPQFAHPFYGSMIPSFFLEGYSYDSRCFNLLARAIDQLKNDFPIDLQSADTLLLVATTKGPIDLLDTTKEVNVIKAMQSFLKSAYQPKNTPEVISLACVSGIAALDWGKQYLEASLYKQVIVIGVDILSPFVVAGFQSFQSLENGICKPYDKDRKGLNIGEAVALAVLSKMDCSGKDVQIIGAAGSNDANHISGPSRTGEGLMQSMDRAINDAGITTEQIDAINAHGTATPYNDEMESKAMGLLKIDHKPLNSLKGYIGHTLGASGLVESLIGSAQMDNRLVLGTFGFKEMGVSIPLNVSEHAATTKVNILLKTGSGFGGVNYSVLLKRGGQND
ncbi:beta-ketoacyl synthase N-terminal-like domain-containing protein [Persicobacter psychrovividus]|uniref:Beta-ketoacyl synthase n=1 Tax=Persicobacter psychrovividus TaxID=387638 RepID=A0ABM7VM99_9BACT|nr:beta-ketoacyl synthase [Persicobacter psychrovividus]